MSSLTFADDMARLQRALAECHDMVVRRTAVLEALRLCSRERVLEVGCGGGVYAYEAAQCVGPTGRVCALDLSADQIASAKARCAELAWVECQAPYPDLPAILPARLRQFGMTAIRQTPVPVLNTSYHANSFSYWLARMIRPFVLGRQAVTAEEAAAWFNEFEELEQRGAYFFSSTPIITEATTVGAGKRVL